MPRRKKDEEQETEAQTEAVKPSEVTAVISTGKLKKLMAASRACIRDAAQIASAFAADVKDAKKNHHLHTRAFKDICKLDKMEPEELCNYMDHYEHYFEVSGLKKRADSVMRMDMGEGDDREEDEDSNVKPFPAAAGSA